MKVLIIGISYFHYAISLVRAGELLGYTVKSLWLTEFRNCKKNYWKIKASKYGIKYFERKYLKKVNENFIKEIIDFQPNICIILNGKDIDAEVLGLLKKQSAKVALFMSDSIQYNCYQQVLFNIAQYDWVFSYEPTDIDFVKNTLKYEKISYLPLGYDETLFFKKTESKKKYDICFVGVLNEKRFKILNKVAEYAGVTHKKLIIYTNPLYPEKYFWHGIRNYFRKKKFNKKYPYIMKYITDQPIYNGELASLYRESKVCINIHSDGLHTGVNPRTFEILGCGSFEVVDRGHLSKVTLEDEQHLIEFSDEEDLCQKIDIYLNDEEKRENIALAAWTDVKQQYTMKKCIEHIVSNLLK